MVATSILLTTPLGNPPKERDNPSEKDNPSERDNPSDAIAGEAR